MLAIVMCYTGTLAIINYSWGSVTLAIVMCYTGMLAIISYSWGSSTLVVVMCCTGMLAIVSYSCTLAIVMCYTGMLAIISYSWGSGMLAIVMCYTGMLAIMHCSQGTGMPLGIIQRRMARLLLYQRNCHKWLKRMAHLPTVAIGWRVLCSTSLVGCVHCIRPLPVILKIFLRFTKDD